MRDHEQHHQAFAAVMAYSDRAALQSALPPDTWRGMAEGRHSWLQIAATYAQMNIDAMLAEWRVQPDAARDFGQMLARERGLPTLHQVLRFAASRAGNGSALSFWQLHLSAWALGLVVTE